jgi:uncharacterized protein (TIGR02246 family)
MRSGIRRLWRSRCPAKIAGMPTTSPSDAPADDVEALLRRVAELERTQQHEDVEGFLALFDPTAVWVTGGGVRLIGLDVIAEFTRRVLPGAMSDGSVTYEVEHVAFVQPDVALTGVRQQYLDRLLGSQPISGAGRAKNGRSSPTKTRPW